MRCGKKGWGSSKMINLLAICHTTPQDLINAWGEKKYGKKGRYGLETGYSQGCPTCEGTTVFLKVECNGREVDRLDTDFCQLLNEILGGK